MADARWNALIAKWATLNPGTTDQKLAQLNALTVNDGPVVMIIPTYKIYNLIDATEWLALSAVNQQNVRDILSMGQVDVSPGTNARARLTAIFPNATAPITRAALIAFANTFDAPQIPWWQASVAQGGGGLTSPVGMADLVSAGGLT